jgi:predicted DNA binding protein
VRFAAMLWTAKLRAYDQGNLLGSRARKFKLTIYYYPINHYEQDGIYYFIAMGLVKGTPQNIRKCFRELRKTTAVKQGRYIARLEVNKETFLSVTAQKSSVESRKLVRFFYNPSIIHINPAVIHPDGSEEWDVCSFNKADLERIITIGEHLYNLQLVSLRRANVTNLHIVSASPRLSRRQKTVLELAIKKGYYRYPRSVGLAGLAKESGISVSTFQAHLRKAENKVIPRVFCPC